MPTWAVHISYRSVRGALERFDVVVKAGGAIEAVAEAERQLSRRRRNVTLTTTVAREISEENPAC